MPKRNADQNPPATQLNARGLSLRDHYRHEFPKWMQKLRAKREEEQFFLDLQRRYEDTEARLAEQDLPPVVATRGHAEGLDHHEGSA